MAKNKFPKTTNQNSSTNSYPNPSTHPSTHSYADPSKIKNKNTHNTPHHPDQIDQIDQKNPTNQKNPTDSSSRFDQLISSPQLLQALHKLNLITPTPIQAQSIPIALSKRDLVAQAQTGTGKTAAFALPTIENLDLDLKCAQVLVITPTRELALQVATAYKDYAQLIPKINIACIYGGQDYNIQIRALKKGPQIIVATPGRLIDLLKQKYLKLDNIQTIVLDEADEMLKMGFAEEINWVMQHAPDPHQTCLFSATIPAAIQQIAKKYLTDPITIRIKTQTTTVASTEQVFVKIAQPYKLEVLKRFLATEDIDAAIIFARTKNWSNELAEKLQADGYKAAAINGDMAQSLREKVIGRLKSGEVNILVATDVAARGIDVKRITHVFNYDIPQETEAYIHRIGRTGRAGRSGKAILLMTPKEQYLLNNIERAINTRILKIDPPSTEQVNSVFENKLEQNILNKVKQLIPNASDASDTPNHQNKNKKLEPYANIIKKILAQGEYSAEQIATALAHLSQPKTQLPTSIKDATLQATNKNQFKTKHTTQNKYQSNKNQSNKNQSNKYQSNKYQSNKKPAATTAPPKKRRKYSNKNT